MILKTIAQKDSPPKAQYPKIQHVIELENFPD